MAICVVRSTEQLDLGLVLTPERYNPKRRINTNDGQSFCKLSEFVTLANDLVTSREPGNFLVLNTSDARGGCVNIPHTSVDMLSSSKKRIRKGDVIISRLRPYLKQIAYCDVDFDNLVGSTEFYVLRSRVEGDSIAFLLPFLLSETVQRVFQSAVEGSQHPRFQPQDLLELPLPQNLVEKKDSMSERVEMALAHYRMYNSELGSLVNDCESDFEAVSERTV